MSAEPEDGAGEIRIEDSWLVRDVNEHTCGTAKGGHYGLHEPGCGTVPEVNLATLPGWDALCAAIAMGALEQAALEMLAAARGDAS